MAFQLVIDDSLIIDNMEDITWPHGDTKFLFEC